MLRSTMCAALATVALTMLAPLVRGHGLLATPTPRTGTTQAGGNKNSGTPCGRNTATKGAISATLAAGSQTTVSWTMGAAHNGPCTIKIAGGDPGGAPDFSNVAVVAGGQIAACNAQPRSATITVPAGLPAGDAVLQWFWQGDGTYENCADITITGGAPTPAPTADQAAAQRVLQAQATSVGQVSEPWGGGEGRRQGGSIGCRAPGP
jgi:predicted carbohydrate-binding protein with CBM5 and CBM33 domain